MKRKQKKPLKLRTRHMPEKVESNKKKIKWDNGTEEYFRTEGYYYDNDYFGDDDIPDEDKF